jgi:hypothetical protein
VAPVSVHQGHECNAGHPLVGGLNMKTFHHDMREAGMYAIETYCEVAQNDMYGRFETVSCFVVYGDKDRPSYSIRIFLFGPEA